MTARHVGRREAGEAALARALAAEAWPERRHRANAPWVRP